MSCSFNYLLSDPRDRSCLGMAGAGALSRVHVGAEGLSIAACDQSNAFTRVKVPGWMVPYLATPPVVAEAVWDLLPSDLRESIAPTTMVSPCYNRLPMGCSHSVHILMSINMQSIGMTLRSSLKLGSPNVRGEGTLEEAQSSQSSVGNPVENPQPDTYTWLGVCRIQLMRPNLIFSTVVVMMFAGKDFNRVRGAVRKLVTR